MKASDIPGKIQLPFAESAGAGYKRTVPVASQIGITDGAASYTDGFPPLNFLPVASGGVPPFGQDFNGLLNAISALSRWFSSGAPIAYDATFSTAIGGYPKGAIVQSVSTFGNIWISTVDDNTTDPDAGGLGWSPFPMFVMSLATSGYLVLPGGFILQWYTTTGSVAGSVSSFPITFPNAVYAVMCSINANGPTITSNGWIGASAISTSQVAVWSAQGSPSVTILAIGK